jgi:hypothetical protein
MIKTIGLLTRKNGWTHEQFVKHWVETHAPLAHTVPACAATCRATSAASARAPTFRRRGRDRRHRRAVVRRPGRASKRQSRTPEMKALHADGALFIGRIKSYIVEEKIIVE